MFKSGDRVKKKNGTPFSNDKIYDTVYKMFNGNQVYLNETGSWVGIEDIEIDESSVSPVRTVTRREIVPGNYGRVEVVTGADEDVEVNIRLTDRCGHPHGIAMCYDSAELREAAHMFNQLAEVLEENK